jgi:hypothetical protein
MDDGTSGPPNDPPAKGRGSLIALTVFALSAVIPLATVAGAEDRGKSDTDASRFSETKKKPRAARAERRGGFVIPVIANQTRRKPPVGIPGRRDY